MLVALSAWRKRWKSCGMNSGAMPTPVLLTPSASMVVVPERPPLMLRLNPGTGWPADALRQVTVVARTGIEADALSTAMLVSGKPTLGVIRYYTA